MVYLNKYIKPGFFEVYSGPMFSGKTEGLIKRIAMIKDRIPNNDVLIIKPETDTRDEGLKSRTFNVEYSAIFVPGNKPRKILDIVANEKSSNPEITVVAIDEAQFFIKELVYVVSLLLEKDYNVLASGLPLDFKAEPFGAMPDLLALADKVYNFTAVCDHHGCGSDATRTQRLVNGDPVEYDSLVELVEGTQENVTYEARCLNHFIVPGRQKEILSKLNNIKKEKN
jgi:thymidine kinase